ncbi:MULTISPECIES: serine hydrolase [unclassified Lysinibacillus]|uniref:serine hydrolase domain-containing protein n=1 Tax=unclassified Lysinibacillus TaxID=2636778 RepID=UPI0021039599|nr:MULTISPECIES: serine hydrolase domain-containing protein [unclassified Lysinibacillus]
MHSVENTYQTLDCTGAALVIFHNNELKVEQYYGKQSAKEDARLVQPDTKFHIASCRKSYVAFAVAYALHYGYIRSLDDEILMYLPLSHQKEIYKGTTIRHLVTHSHGLTESNGEGVREFTAGTSWAYRGINVELISEIIQFTTKKTIAAIVNDEVFTPLNFTETNWYNTFDDTFVDVIGKENNRHWSASKNLDGSKMNMYVSARELAKWGLIHLNKGSLNGEQVLDPNIFKLATTIQSTPYSNVDLPDNGIFWFVKASQAKKSEIGALVPNGAYQILGYTTVTLLVIPSENIVAVRAFNSYGNPEGYDYLKDVRAFGDAIILDLK